MDDNQDNSLRTWDLIIDCNQPVLLIDLSYLIFYRYYAVLKWCEYVSQDKVDAASLLSNHEFMEKYDKLFKSVLIDLSTQHGISKNLILVRDCARQDIWRFEHLSQYKGTRDENNQRFNKDIFGYTLKTLLPKLKKELNFQMTHNKSLDADDCIALIKISVRSKSTIVNIAIISNDSDFVQLIDSNTILKNLQNIDLNLKFRKIDPKIYLETKIIMGDKSDNIPAIARKIGPKTSEKFAKDKTLLEAFFQKDHYSKKQYLLNRLLIDFNSIPDGLKTSYLSTICLTGNSDVSSE